MGAAARCGLLIHRGAAARLRRVAPAVVGGLRAVSGGRHVPDSGGVGVRRRERAQDDGRERGHDDGDDAADHDGVSSHTVMGMSRPARESDPRCDHPGYCCQAMTWA